MTRYRRRLLLLLFPVALLGVRCNSAECESKRDELWALKDRWTQCQTDLDCVKILGSPGDCTGILSCDFAINRSNRLEAERRIASLPEETVDCTSCSGPNCVSGLITLCEAASQRCILVTSILDAGTPEGTGGTDSGEGTGGTDPGEGTAGTDPGEGSGGALPFPAGGSAGTGANGGTNG